MTNTLPSILIIDDEKDIALVVARLLKAGGFVTREFHEPLKALEHFILNPNGYDLVISDIRMPYMNGLELARKIRGIRPDIRIVLMTAFEINSFEFEKVLPNTRIDGFIEKPVRAAKLMEMICSYAT